MPKMQRLPIVALLILLTFPIVTNAKCGPEKTRGTGDMGIIIERATGSLLVVEHSAASVLCRVEGLGDLSHASAVFSRDARYVFIFGRDGGLTRIDILQGKITHRIVQGGNAIGGAISQDGKLVAVSNYEPGGVRIFNADDLSMVADIPAKTKSGRLSKTVGLVDVPGQQFMFSLFEGAAIWNVDMSETSAPQITKYDGIGLQPYDGLISGDGRYYIAGLFGEDGLAMMDLWQPQKGVKRILPNYGKGEKKLPVYKMPHLEGWAMTDDYAFLPAVGQHKVLVVNRSNWKKEKAIPVKSQPVFAMASPTGREIWVNFAFPDNQWIQVIDSLSLEVIETLEVGKGALHMEFTPRADQVWISVRDKNQVKIYDVRSRRHLKTLDVKSPSGIFFSHRSARIGL